MATVPVQKAQSSVQLTVNAHDVTILSCTNQYFCDNNGLMDMSQVIKKTALIICGPTVLQRLPLLFCTSSARLHK